jgi:hypothetical protein
MVYCVREAKGVSNVAQTLWSRALDPLMAESIGRGLESSLCRAVLQFPRFTSRCTSAVYLRMSWMQQG